MSFPQVLKTTNAATPPDWVVLFAQLVAAGTSLVSCAQRLNRPKAQLYVLFDDPSFKDLVKAAISESSSDSPEKLISSTKIDSILKLISLRDSHLTPPKDVIRICMYFLDRKDLAGSDDSLADSLNKHGKDLDGGLDKEIMRFLESNPNLRATTNKFRSQSAGPDEPEPRRREVGLVS